MANTYKIGRYVHFIYLLFNKQKIALLRLFINL